MILTTSGCAFVLARACIHRNVIVCLLTTIFPHGLVLFSNQDERGKGFEWESWFYKWKNVRSICVYNEVYSITQIHRQTQCTLGSARSLIDQQTCPINSDHEQALTSLIVPQIIRVIVRFFILLPVPWTDHDIVRRGCIVYPAFVQYRVKNIYEH